MTVEEFLKNAPKALDAADSEASKTRGALENWLVTIAVGLLALPSLIGKDYHVTSLCLWRLLVAAHVLLVLSILLVLSRGQIMLARLNLNASLVKDMVDRIAQQGNQTGSDAETEEEYEKLSMRARSLHKSELFLSWCAIVVFMLGLAAMSAVSLAAARPTGCPSSNTRVYLPARAALASTNAS